VEVVVAFAAGEMMVQDWMADACCKETQVFESPVVPHGAPAGIVRGITLVADESRTASFRP